MDENLIKAKNLLLEHGYTCVVCGKGEVYASKLRGVRPLVAWVEKKQNFAGCFAADKVVGKGAAVLYSLLEVQAVYADVISRAALDWLECCQIQVKYGTLVEYIVNRSGDGICPFEAAVLEIYDKTEAYEAICKTMKKMQIK